MSTNDARPLDGAERDCTHEQAFMCDENDLHPANRGRMWFYCIDCSLFLGDDLTPIAGDLMRAPCVTEGSASPRCDAGASPADEGQACEAQEGRPRDVQESSVQLAGLPNLFPHAFTGVAGMQLLSVPPPSPGQNGAGSPKATKAPKETKRTITPDDDEKYGKVLPGPWDATQCPDIARQNCVGKLKAFYTVEFENGHSFFYKCDTCCVIISISDRESKGKYHV